MGIKDTQSAQSSLNVLFLASEADPLIKVGGLGDVAGSLPAAIQGLNGYPEFSRTVDIRLAIPFHAQIKAPNLVLNPAAHYFIRTNTGRVKVEVFSTMINGVITYLISSDLINAAGAVYSHDNLADLEKYILFSLASLHLPKALNWQVDILHANDWHTAIAVHELKAKQSTLHGLSSAHSVLTIHNLPFMGTESPSILKKYGIDQSDEFHLPDWSKRLPLTMGIGAADAIVAVSPTYAKEVITTKYGCGMQEYLKLNKNRLSGILNGLDTKAWDPSTDTAISNRFDLLHLNERFSNKTNLQKEFNFEIDKKIPLLIMIGRMDKQKGIDIILGGLRKLKDLSWNAILLGTGDKMLEQACLDLQAEFPTKVRTVISFNPSLSRRMYSGADILLMPSRYEPCGLAQMIAMRYGCIPVARDTGGLADTIIDNPKTDLSTGFLFTTSNSDSFSKTLRKAILIFGQQATWSLYQHNAMKQDYSWTISAKKYIKLYKMLCTPNKGEQP